MESDSTRWRPDTIRSKIQRLTKIAVNNEAKIPIDRVTANPRIGPVPNWNKNTAAISVVMFASSTDERAFPKPASIADLTVLP